MSEVRLFVCLKLKFLPHRRNPTVSFRNQSLCYFGEKSLCIFRILRNV